MTNLQFTLKGKADTREVHMNGKKLHPSKSQKVHNHSPDGFNWGYEGSGPAQLALSIMLELFDRVHALARYQSFKQRAIFNLPNSDFSVIVTMAGTKIIITKNQEL